MENKNVFISYKSEEIGEADWVRSTLENNGISCWMAPACIPGGSSYASEIPKAIKNCRVFVLILTSAAQRSKWVAKEVDLAINEGKIIMPFMPENCPLENEFNFYLTNVQRYAAYEDRSGAVNKMISEIKEVLGIKSGAAYDPYRFFTPQGAYSGTRPESVKSQTPPKPQTPPKTQTQTQVPPRTSGAQQIRLPDGATANIGGVKFDVGGYTATYRSPLVKPKKRKVLFAFAVFFYIMAACGAFVVFDSGIHELIMNLGLAAFYLIFGIMFHVLSRSPKNMPRILGKISGMKKSTFVIMMVALAIFVCIACEFITDIVFSYIFLNSYYY